MPSPVLNIGGIGWIRSSSAHQGTHSLVLDADIELKCAAMRWEWWWEQAQGIVAAQKGSSKLVKSWGRVRGLFLEATKVLELGSNKGLVWQQCWGEGKHATQREQHKQSQEAGNSMEHDPTSHAALLRWELTARAWGAMRIERNRGSSRTVRSSSVRGID